MLPPQAARYTPGELRLSPPRREYNKRWFVIVGRPAGVRPGSIILSTLLLLLVFRRTLFLFLLLVLFGQLDG